MMEMDEGGAGGSKVSMRRVRSLMLRARESELVHVCVPCNLKGFH